MTLRCIAACALAAAAFAAFAEDFDLLHVKLVDGTGATPRPGMSVAVRDGRIAAISDRPRAARTVA